MARYYLAVLMLNILFSVLFYIKMKHSGLSLRSFILISGISLLSGVVFPILTGLTNLYVALGINIILVSLSAYFVAEREGVLDQEAEGQSFEAVSYLTQRYENQETELTDTESIDDESTNQEPTNQESTDEELVDEEVMDEEKEATDEASREEQAMGVEFTDQQVTDEELTDQQVADETSTDEEIDEESVHEKIIDEESSNQQVDEELKIPEVMGNDSTDDESTGDESKDDKAMDDNDNDITDEKIIEYLIDTEDEMEMVAAAAESEQEVDIEFDLQGEWVMNSPQVNAYDDGEIRESYINRGFESKFEGKLDKAVKFFTAALELSPPPDLELMLSLDLFSMLRELGYYDRAKDCLNKFAERNYSGLSPAEAEEIKISLKHLEILKDLLAKANTPGLPYSRVPALIKLSADEKLNSWKSETF